jgi:hypothetical protein
MQEHVRKREEHSSSWLVIDLDSLLVGCGIVLYYSGLAAGRMIWAMNSGKGKRFIFLTNAQVGCGSDPALSSLGTGKFPMGEAAGI